MKLPPLGRAPEADRAERVEETETGAGEALPASESPMPRDWRALLLVLEWEDSTPVAEGWHGPPAGEGQAEGEAELPQPAAEAQG